MTDPRHRLTVRAADEAHCRHGAVLCLRVNEDAAADLIREKEERNAGSFARCWTVMANRLSRSLCVSGVSLVNQKIPIALHLSETALREAIPGIGMGGMTGTGTGTVTVIVADIVTAHAAGAAAESEIVRRITRGGPLRRAEPGGEDTETGIGRTRIPTEAAAAAAGVAVPATAVAAAASAAGAGRPTTAARRAEM